MGWLKKQLKSIAKRNPANKIMDKVGISENNTLRQVLDPMAAAHRNIENGMPMTASNILDPGHFLTPPDYAKKVQTVNPNNARNMVASQMSTTSTPAQTRGGSMQTFGGAPSASPNYGDINAIIDYVGSRKTMNGALGGAVDNSDFARLNGGMVNDPATPQTWGSDPKAGAGNFMIRDPKRSLGRIYR